MSLCACHLASATLQPRFNASWMSYMEMHATTTPWHTSMTVTFSRPFKEHLEHLRIILGRVQNASLTVHAGKMQLATSKINLLGFVIDNVTLHPNKDKLKAITEFLPPHDTKSLQKFLGMVGFYHQFIPHCAEIALPLNKLLRKGVKWRWTEAQQNDSLQLSKDIADTASLKLRDLNRPFILQTDASGYGLGAVLPQEFHGVPRPVAFASHTLTHGVTLAETKL